MLASVLIIGQWLVERVWMNLLAAAAITLWPLEAVWELILRQRYRPERQIAHQNGGGGVVVVDIYYQCDHSTASPNLLRTNMRGACKLLGWMAWGLCSGRAGCEPVGVWLWFCVGCLLFLPLSDSQFIHDYIFDFPRWLSGAPITWRQANAAMLHRLRLERQPWWVRAVYWLGISGRISRHLWNNHIKRDGRPRAT